MVQQLFMKELLVVQVLDADPNLAVWTKTKKEIGKNTEDKVDDSKQ